MVSVATKEVTQKEERVKERYLEGKKAEREGQKETFSPFYKLYGNILFHQSSARQYGTRTRVTPLLSVHCDIF